MHQSTCSVIKDQIKLISDNSPGEHLSRPTYKKCLIYIKKKKSRAGGCEWGWGVTRVSNTHLLCSLKQR